MSAYVIDADRPAGRTFYVQKDDPFGDNPAINVLLEADLGFFLETFEFGLAQAVDGSNLFHTLLHVVFPAPGYW